MAQTGRVVHQDYIVRQRYSNSLPPPPGAPKLLTIPNNGMDLYTMPFYAAPLLREQPLNIEADAFLGMPIDLVGMPGVFEGDEASIQAPDIPPAAHHPRDQALLTPLKALGKKKGEASDTTFLRRTQYTAEERARLEAARGAGKVNVNKRLKSDASAGSKDDPTYILRSVIKGFDIANPASASNDQDTATNIRGLTATHAEKDAWNKPKHPSKPHLRPLDSYPIVPDLDSTTAAIAYGVVRLSGMPTTKTDGPDRGLQVSLLHALDPAPDEAAEWEARRARHQADPANTPAPPAEPNHDYNLFYPVNERTAANFARKADARAPDRDAAYANDDEGSQAFKFENLRRYAIGMQHGHEDFPYQEVALVLCDEEEGGAARQRGAYYLPITSKQQLKPRPGGERDDVDFLEVEVRDMDDEELDMKRNWLATVDVRDEDGEA